ncbi:MAG: hypothetical protein GXP42_02760 [Chloroflexi bacterium]|nr:hypothetical protein [Chloroflexota bacterium]
MFYAITTLVAIGLALLGAWWLPDPETRLRGAALFVAAAALAVVSFRHIERTWPRQEPEEQASPYRTRFAQLVGLLVLLVGLALTLWTLVDIWRRPFAWDMAARWFFGLTLMVGGAYVGGGPQVGQPGWVRRSLGLEPNTPRAAGPRPADYKLRAIGADETNYADASGAGLTAATFFEPTYSRGVEIALVALIMFAAIFFRVHLIRSVPPGIFIDETNAALDALRILEGRPDSLFGTGWFETPNGFVYLQTLFFRLFGTTFFALKVQSLLPGILTVLALYFLAREMFGVRPALIATAFLAVNRWHINMSRWGWNEVYPPLIQILALLFILRGARRQRWGDWALAGLLLGLGMYTYLAIRLVALGVALYLLYRILVERGFLRKSWQGLVLFSTIYLLTFAPLGFTYYKNPFTFLNRSQQVSILNDIRAAGGDLQPLKESALRHLKMFHVQGDRNARHNLPGEPMLDPITGAFFLLGLVWALWRWRDHKHGLLFIWILTGLLGGVLSQLNEAPQAYRTLAVTPAIALLAADAYDLALRGIVHPGRLYHLWRWGWGILAVIGIVATGWLNYDLYFNRQAQDRAVYVAFSPLENIIAREVLAKRADHRLYLSPRLYYFAPLRFLAYEPSRFVGFKLGPIEYSPFPELGGGLDQPGYHLAEPVLDLPLPDLGGDNASFLLDLHYEYLLEHFRYFYPGVQSQIIADRFGQPLYLSVTIPGDEITALQAANRADAASEIRGLYIPASGEYAIIAASGAQVMLDGRPLDPNPQFLGKGLHAIEIASPPADLAPDAPILFWEGAGGSGPIPDSALFRVPPSGKGLLGTYYMGSDWTPPAFMQRVDPFILFAWPDPEPVFGPFSATWAGELQVPTDGPYAFRLHADDGVRFWLDGQVVGESLNPDTVNQVDAALDLKAGPHSVRIDYFQRGGGKALEFFWAPPGQPLQPVAPAYLRPSGP